MQFNFALLHLHADAVFGGQAFVTDIAHKTTRPVAAVLYLTTVGVVNDVLKIEGVVGRGTNRQNLIGTHPKMSVGQESVLGSSEIKTRTRFVEHHKIVARTLHFCKANSHARIILGSDTV